MLKRKDMEAKKNNGGVKNENIAKMIVNVVKESRKVAKME
jgi:hypothetical protein